MDDTALFRLAFEAVVAAGAAQACPNHPDQLLDRQLDDDLLAARQGKAWDAYVAAAKAAGFIGDPDSTLQFHLIHVLQSVSETCPDCGAVIAPPDDPADRRRPHPWAEKNGP